MKKIGFGQFTSSHFIDSYGAEFYKPNLSSIPTLPFEGLQQHMQLCQAEAFNRFEINFLSKFKSQVCENWSTQY